MEGAEVEASKQGLDLWEHPTGGTIMVCQAAVTMEAMGEDQPPIIIATQVVDLVLALVDVERM
jgi:hypothetical protein